MKIYRCTKCNRDAIRGHKCSAPPQQPSGTAEELSAERNPDSQGWAPVEEVYQLRKERDDARAEAARYREALDKIADIRSAFSNLRSTSFRDFELREIARAAISQPEKPEGGS